MNNMKLEYCESCRRNVEYGIVNMDKIKLIKGKNIIYPIQKAYCVHCNSEIFVKELRDDNLKSLNKEFDKIKQ